MLYISKSCCLPRNTNGKIFKRDVLGDIEPSIRLDTGGYDYASYVKTTPDRLDTEDIYQNGLKIQYIQYWYDSDGNKISKKTFKGEVYDGEHIYYNKDGSILKRVLPLELAVPCGIFHAFSL